MTSYFAPEVAK